MKNTDLLMGAKIRNLLECINLMLKDLGGVDAELVYWANNSIYKYWVDWDYKLVKDGRDLEPQDILNYLIGFREGLCLN